ncbi:hypothetical protein [Pseudonocardia sp. WMMC193]|uniref:hypothetical protein n=1 Tax=Pseudonocardia sp. WMMC193 TaxID=2911965 RepID=UPI001F398B0C|nr:hypothetical protein [Pseudonocardia sp. WMMC193]MCF7547205.1 hypothetical protein [Pseudonocardia sp. WMMC193]
MEPVILTALLIWGLTRYAGTELMATARGTEPPRIKERRERASRAHERSMAKAARRSGPTVGEALGRRIADRIARPRSPKPPGPARQALGEWWSDSWGYATDRRRRRHDRYADGDLGRQRAARWLRQRWSGRQQDPQSGPQWADTRVTDDPGPPDPDDIVDAEVVEDPPPSTPPTATPPTNTHETTSPDARPDSPEPVEPEQPQPGPDPADKKAPEPPDPEHETDPDDTQELRATPDTGMASVHPIRKALPMTTPTGTMTSGETLDPTAAHRFAQEMATFGQNAQTQIELSLTNLSSRGVSGAPIEHFQRMFEAMGQFVASAQEASAHFARHIGTQDQVLSDDTLSGTVQADTYLGARG